jgi:hypothetical protein
MADAEVRQASAAGRRLAAVTVLAPHRRGDHVGFANRKLRTDREQDQAQVISPSATFLALSG